ncbi:MAG: hypothetical protein U1E16_04505 [Hyphomicrobiales bacterium]
MHQLGRTLDHLRVLGARSQQRVGQAHDAIVGPGLHRQESTVVDQKAHEVDMRPAGVETGIDMREGNRDQPFRAHDLRRPHHETCGQRIALPWAPSS